MTHKGTIAYFSARYLPSMGGVEFFTRSLSQELARRGYDVIVVTTEPDPDGTCADELALGQDMGEKSEGAGSVFVVRLDSWGWSRVPFVRWSARSREGLRRVREAAPCFSLVNTRFYGLSRVGVRLMGRLGVRSVLIDHGSNYVSGGSALLSAGVRALEHLLTARLKRMPVDFVGVSATSSEWLRTFGITSCGEVNNAIDADAFAAQASERDLLGECGIGEGTLSVVYAGRLIEDKGVRELLEAARSLAGRDGIRLVVAGAGPLEGEVASAAAELPNLDFVGRLDHTDLARLLVQADVLCLPSWSEGYATTILEAASCGCALVYTPTGGAAEMIPTDDYGIVIDKHDARGIERALERLADDRALLARLKENASRRVREVSSWGHTADQALAACEAAQRRGV